MTESQMIIATFLVGQILPPVYDLLNREIPQAKLRFWISIILSTGVGILFNAGNLNFQSFDNILLSGAIIWISAQIAYKSYYEHSKQQENIRYSGSLPAITNFIPVPLSLTADAVKGIISSKKTESL